MSSWWKLGKIAPAIMVSVAAANFVLCFCSRDWLAFRTWEVATSVESPGGAGPFQPEQRIEIERAYGDLAGLGNLRKFREYRREEFQTDRFGFRNAGLDARKEFAGFVIGDSFVAGGALSDSDTLAVRLSRKAGVQFYNAGGDKACLANAEAASSILKLSSGVAIYVLLERTALSVPGQISDSRADCIPARAANRARWQVPAVFPGNQQAELFLSDHSPGVILSRNIVKELQNDVWVPNPYASAVIPRKLENGDGMLFYPEEFAKPGNPALVAEKWRTFLAEFSARLAKNNVRTVVVLVPNKATVYGGMLQPGFDDFHGGELLDQIETELRRAGISAVNLTKVFQSAARDRVANRDYIYWRDDTHWNPEGVQIAADSIWADLREMAIPSAIGQSSAEIAQTTNR